MDRTLETEKDVNDFFNNWLLKKPFVIVLDGFLKMMKLLVILFNKKFLFV